MDFSKKLIDQLSDLSRNIKSLTSEVKDSKNTVLPETSTLQKEPSREEKEIIKSKEEENKNFLKSLEEIFKKGIGEITKSSEKSSDLLKGIIGSGLTKEIVTGGTPNKEKGGILDKIPKFYSGGIMGETGLALVGEKGPEIVNLKKGSEVIPNEKSSDLLSSMKTADQSLIEKRGPTSEQIEKYKNSLLDKDSEGFYKKYPEALEGDVEIFIKKNRFKNTKSIDKDIDKSGEESLAKEDLTRLSEIQNKLGIIQSGKEEKKGAEDLLSGKESSEEKKEKSILLEKAKKFSEDKKLLEKGKNILISKGKESLGGKKEEGNSFSSILGNKNELASKGVTSATSLIDIKESKENIKGKLENLKSKEVKNKEEKSTMSVETSELKRPQIKEEPKKEEPPKVEEKKPEPPKAETKETPQKKEKEKESPKNTNIFSSGGSPEKSKEKKITPDDLQVVVNLLSRIASLLEGPLSIETMDSPFRPDSRRF